MKNASTKSIRIQAKRSHFREHSSPIYLTSSYIFENAEQARALFNEELPGNIYSRFSNPNTDEFIEKMKMWEKTEDGFAFSTGMAAIFASFAAILSSGDHILASRAVFGSTHQLFTKIFPRWGISHTYIDIAKPDLWEKSIKKNTKILFVETPSNPGLDLVDLKMLGKIKEKFGLIYSVDNCFATPILQQPTDFGADLIIHSATKFIDGQGRVLGGVTLGSNQLIEKIRFFSRHTGPILSAFDAWILSKSLETLKIRIEKHCKNASILAKELEKNPQINNVKYPYLKSHPQHDLAKKQMKAGGGLVTFEVRGGFSKAKEFIDALEFLSITSNLGDTRTTITHPASTTHSKLTEQERIAVGITPGLIRISVGLEDAEDILNEIMQALKKIK
jgi:O-succinylhomoserine sulfhydrylase